MTSITKPSFTLTSRSSLEIEYHVLISECNEYSVIKYSNNKTNNKIIPEEKLFLLGFVPAEVILIKNDVWFTQLNSEQIVFLNEHLLEKKKRMFRLTDY